MITAKRLPDRALVRVLADGSIAPLPDRTDWARLTAMTDEEVEAGAASDPDCRPLTDEQFARVDLAPRVRIIRRALQLTQEAFAARYHIPLGTLRDWEQGRSAPDAPARAYLSVIARDPETVGRLLDESSA
jgi:putative transcriptional regulator